MDRVNLLGLFVVKFTLAAAKWYYKHGTDVIRHRRQNIHWPVTPYEKREEKAKG